jgi:two-component system sensor histidine kinase DegS
LAALAVEAAHHIKTAIHLATTIEAGAAAERSRLAAQIHHGVAQYVANALMRLQLCQRYIVQDPARAEEFLHNAQTHTQMAMDAIRATIYSLQYAEKDAPRIATLLRATTERLRSMTEAEFHLDLNPVGPLSSAIEVGLAAIAEEALTNAAKHANAQNIYVHLTRDKDTIGFEVSDDGSGFPREEDQPDSRSWERFGLTLMRDEAHRLGGTIQIQSAPSGGTQVKVLLPANLRRPTPFQAAEVNPSQQSEPLGRP